MDYEQRYKQALERARELNDKLIKAGTLATSKGIESIFPELHESEDERIRKGLIKGLSAMKNIHNHQTFSDDAINIDDAITWLEKQKEENFIDKNLVKEEAHRIAWEYSKHYDPLLSKESWCEMAALDMAYWFEKQGEQKSSWSEDDEKNLKGIIDEIEANKNNAPDYDLATYDSFLSWLKSIKPNHWKPSEEEMEALLYTLGMGGTYNKEALTRLYNDLKKL